MEVAKAEVMEMPTPPPSDVGSPSRGSPLSLSGGSSNSSSDSEPDSPLCNHGKVWGCAGGPIAECGRRRFLRLLPTRFRTGGRDAGDVCDAVSLLPTPCTCPVPHGLHPMPVPHRHIPRSYLVHTCNPVPISIPVACPLVCVPYVVLYPMPCMLHVLSMLCPIPMPSVPYSCPYLHCHSCPCLVTRTCAPPLYPMSTLIPTPISLTQIPCVVHALCPISMPYTPHSVHVLECIPILCTPCPVSHASCPCVHVHDPMSVPMAHGIFPPQVKQENPPPSPGSQGMLDRSRMALCAFVFLCLSFNPLASLLRGSSAPAPSGTLGTAGPGRSIMAESGTAGKCWHGVEAFGVETSGAGAGCRTLQWRPSG